MGSFPSRRPGTLSSLPPCSVTAADGKSTYTVSVSLTWTEAPAAHAAQSYAGSESVAEYLVAGFEAGEPAIVVTART